MTNNLTLRPGLPAGFFGRDGFKQVGFYMGNHATVKPNGIVEQIVEGEKVVFYLTQCFEFGRRKTIIVLKQYHEGMWESEDWIKKPAQGTVAK